MNEKRDRMADNKLVKKVGAVIATTAGATLLLGLIAPSQAQASVAPAPPPATLGAPVDLTCGQLVYLGPRGYDGQPLRRLDGTQWVQPRVVFPCNQRVPTFAEACEDTHFGRLGIGGAAVAAEFSKRNLWRAAAKRIHPVVWVTEAGCTAIVYNAHH